MFVWFAGYNRVEPKGRGTGYTGNVAAMEPMKTDLLTVDTDGCGPTRASLCWAFSNTGHVVVRGSLPVNHHVEGTSGSLFYHIARSIYIFLFLVGETVTKPNFPREINEVFFR